MRREGVSDKVAVNKKLSKWVSCVFLVKSQVTSNGELSAESSELSSLVRTLGKYL